ncbi:MAG: O-antigen ligase family protein [Capsulimonadales bacterium]|nr:O-antigen ligase family protein [Capsulimonadales bacterium]
MPDNLPKTLIGRVGFGALLLSLALSPILAGYPPGPSYGADLSLAAIRCLVFLAALCLGWAPGEDGDRPDLRERIVTWALRGAVGLTVVSFLAQSRFLTSPVLLFASLPGTLDWLAFGMTTALALRFARGRAAYWLIGALLSGAAVAAVVSVQEYGQYVQAGEPERRAQGVFFGPNFAAGLMALLLPVAVALLLSVRARLPVLAIGALSALMAGALFAAGSRAGLAVTAVGLLLTVGVALSRRKRLPAVFLRTGAFVVVLVVLGFAFRGPLAQRAEAAGREQSGPFRSWTWKGTIAMAQAHPLLGTGPGTYPYVYPSYALVARTDLAHSSYLQMAAEQGIPALALILVALGTALLSGLLRLWDALRTADGEEIATLSMAGLLGGLLAGMARGLVDSEWSVLGNALPFFALVGLVAGLRAVGSAATTKVAPGSRPADPVLAAVALIGLIPGLVGLNAVRQRNVALEELTGARTASERDAALESVRRISVWPPDPQILFYAQKREEAARMEPTGRRYYQLARYRAEQGDLTGAVEAFRKSTGVEPTSMQAWRRLAEAQEQAGDTEGALRSWQQLAALNEGPVGTVRAIPEATETHPAFAYAALARDAAKRGNVSEAATLYDKAARVVESYAATPALYQQMELATAATGIDIAGRREEVKSLYRRVMEEWGRLSTAGADERAKRREETLERLEKMIAPPAPGLN